MEWIHCAPSESALNICDIFSRLEVTLKTIETRFFDAGKKYNRLYLGSYYCDHYFTQTRIEEYMDILRFSRDHDLRTTVVIPPVFQANYDAVCSLAMELLNTEEGTVDEVTVNDWGMASVISELTSVKLNAGRLLQKDNRDPRYADFFDAAYVSRSFSNFYTDFFPDQDITGVEIDCTHKEIVIPKTSRPMQVSVHGPFCYISIGSICEFASMHKMVGRKFRYADVCSRECDRASIICRTQCGRDLLRLGRSVQFENSDCCISSAIPFRYIYSPYRELGVK